MEDAKPAFSRLFYDRNSTAPYVPDPFDRFTAAGTLIYSRGLDKREAGLDFAPQCFFRKRPVVVGFKRNRDEFGSPRQQSITLQAASYNTFSKIGKPVILGRKQPKDEDSRPQGVESQAEFMRVAMRSRVFADDERDRVVYAAREFVFFVPLAEFELPDEPLLLAELDGPRTIRAGHNHKFTVKPLDRRAEVAIDVVPEGMQADGMQLRWKPRPDQAGPAKITVTLKHEEIQRGVHFSLAVVSADGSTKPAATPDLAREVSSLQERVQLLEKRIELLTRLLNEALGMDLKGAVPSDRPIEWQSKPKDDKPIEAYDEIIRLNPKDSKAHFRRANVWANKGFNDKAIADYNEAIRLDPNYAAAHANRGATWAEQGEYEKALADFSAAIRLDPKYSDAYNSQAWIWATCPDARFRDGKKAVEAAARACDLGGWTSPENLDTLAAGYAELGDFVNAVKWQAKATELVPKNVPEHAGFRQRLELYRAGKPYRQLRKRG